MTLSVVVVADDGDLVGDGDAQVDRGADDPTACGSEQHTMPSTSGLGVRSSRAAARPDEAFKVSASTTVNRTWARFAAEVAEAEGGAAEVFEAALIASVGPFEVPGRSK